MIYLSPYNPKWPELFAEDRKSIQAAIGPVCVKVIHIGSTAIPNICAKPVIDIMIGVHRLEDIDSHILVKLANLGYIYIKKYEDEIPYRRFFQKNNSAGVRTHHIHLVEVQSDFWKEHLLFRDYLRAHPEDAKKYDQLKRVLAKKFTDTNEYATAKTDFCKEIYAKALIWVS